MEKGLSISLKSKVKSFHSSVTNSQWEKVSICHLCLQKSHIHGSPHITQRAFRCSSVSSFFSHFIPYQYSANYFNVWQQRRLMYIRALSFPHHQLGNDSQTEETFRAVNEEIYKNVINLLRAYWILTEFNHSFCKLGNAWHIFDSCTTAWIAYIDKPNLYN